MLHSHSVLINPPQQASSILSAAASDSNVVYWDHSMMTLSYLKSAACLHVHVHTRVSLCTRQRAPAQMTLLLVTGWINDLTLGQLDNDVLH